jgi:hypothetical protein
MNADQIADVDADLIDVGHPPVLGSSDDRWLDLRSSAACPGRDPGFICGSNSALAGLLVPLCIVTIEEFG